MMLLRTTWAAAAGIAILGTSSQALGTIAVEVLTVEGAPSCNRFAIRSEITQVQVNDPGASFSRNGPGGQRIEGSVTDGRLEWEARVPVNFVIVTGGGNDDDGPELLSSEGSDGNGTRSNVYLFKEGVTFDNDETAPDMTQIMRVRFCYGLEDFADSEPLPRCSDLENGPICPVDGEEERNGVIVFLDFDAQVFGAASTENQCTCGNVELDDCAEGLPADEAGSCAGGELRETPVSVEAIRNVRDGGPDATTVCTTVDGKRVCKTR